MSISDEAALLGRIAIHYKLITSEQLQQALARQAAMSAPSRRPLGDLLLEMNFISKEQQDWLVAAQSQMLKRSGNGASGTPSGTGGTTTFPAQRASAPVPATKNAKGAATASSPAAKASPSPLAPATTPDPDPSTPAPEPVRVEAPERTQIVPQSKLPTLEQILTRAAEAKASDVHIHAGAPLQMRVGGVLKELKVGVINAGSTQLLLMSALTDEQRVDLEKNRDLDFAIQLKCGRFRVNFYKQQRGWDGVFRPIPPTPPSLQELGLPKTLERLTEWHQGLVLITGPAGCGKSSTLAALVDLINRQRKEHIITVEDPIEFIHASKSCVVNQRQAGKHTLSFANALRAALREDPDVIVIGELRDLETISLAITAAETGHLVLATLHTNSAIRTINRILDVFPPKQQSQVRAMVSESLKAIVSQRLVPTPDGSRRVPALEVLFVKPSVSNLIRDEKTFQIRSVMQTGKADGMAVLDDALAELVKAGTINKQTARRYAEDPKRFS